ncbi:hypothetical protein QYF36_019054 [Acer negundo]|nr:hypothetical protein QYF36_019054 [Acer negundo]
MACVEYQAGEIPVTSDELPRCVGQGTKPLKKGLGIKWLWLPTKPKRYRVPQTSCHDTLGREIPGTSDELPRCLEPGMRPPKKGLGIEWPWLPTKPMRYRVPRTSYHDALGRVRNPQSRNLRLNGIGCLPSPGDIGYLGRATTMFWARYENPQERI